MRLPDLPFKANRKVKKNIIVFKGINQNSLIADDELSSCKNISFSLNSPLISCRGPREVTATLTAPKALFAINDKLVLVDDTDFIFGGTSRGAVAAGPKSMVDFNGMVAVFPDKKQYKYVESGDFGLPGSTEQLDDMTDTGPLGVPDMDYACVHMNRIFGVKGNDIYCCKQGNIGTWTTYDNTATSAWAADVESDGGDFTGIVSYQNHVVIFKKNRMYELYNNKSPFTVQMVNKVGCVSNKGIAEVDSVLYFVNEQGVYAYVGGSPRLVSDKLVGTFTDAVLGTDGKLLYCSLYDTKWDLCVYDTTTGLWWREDSTQAVQMARQGGDTYLLASDGKLYKLNSGTEEISWELETKQYDENTFNKKGLRNVRIRIELEHKSQANIYADIGEEGYSLIKAVSANRVHEVVIRTRMADSYKIKLSGKGAFVLRAFGTDVYMGEV